MGHYHASLKGRETTVQPSLSILGEDGHLQQPLPEFVTAELLLSFYKSMVLTRSFDKKCVALQRTGQLGTYPSCLGQEAIGTGIGYAMHPEDILVPYYRDQATQLIRGVSMVEQLLFWGGDERGNCFANASQDLPNCIPIATQCSHAAGIASALKLRQQKHAVVCTLGDGATSKGDFLETLNVAGVWQLPLVLVINNNQWAISTPSYLQSASRHLADKAQLAGIEGIRVDGNDVIAVYSQVAMALKKARSGKGPTLIEAISYRLGDHTTADDASRYRNNEDVNQAWQREPIKRLQTLLHQQHFWNPEDETQLQRHCQELVEKAVQQYLNLPPQQPEDLFDHLFARLPDAYRQQRDALLQKARLRHNHGEG
ncbi:MAG: pyruvate dehydrogenase (acetyl-transferring) E1 component subunit alpha [Candidatus Pelagadaptatus aseana]|uniref:pyruvate dehydrogenase (acetyl-transferring) E1 component subunit alpha n=1 Tax=Candidatus Pelagadaptatus aseana TaxID=3120508 RepID=UPI0039B1F323